MVYVKESKTICEMEALYPLMVQMYHALTRDEYKQVLSERTSQGYRMVAVFDDNGKAQAIAGFWISYRFYCKKFLQIDNMIADEARTVKGCGKILIDWLKTEAKAQGCERILLDTFVENFDAHRLFMREGFIARGYHYNYILD